MVMSSVKHICNLCEEEDVSNVAFVWCADCETFLCKDCERHHSKNRASKGHQTMALNEYKKLPPFIADIKSRLGKYLKSRITNLQENKTESLKEIRNLRSSINNHLDEIEKKIVDDLIGELDKIKLKSDQFNSEIDNKKKGIKNLQNDLSQMIMYATDLQIYEGLQYLENSISSEVEYLYDMKRKGHLDAIRIETKLSDDLKCLTNNIRTFGTTMFQSSPCNLQLKSSVDCQVRLSVPPLLTIDSINPKLKTTLKIPKSFQQLEIYGCQVLPDGRHLVLEAVSKSVILFSKDGEYTEHVAIFNDEPNDICYIKGNLIAVTILQKRKILLIDLIMKKITKTFQVNGACFGIESNGETLVVSLHGSSHKLLTLDLDGYILSEVTVPGKYTIRMALYKSNILVTNWKDNIIYCYTNNGLLLWEHKHKDICEPFGITVDKNGFIYVACKGNDKIVVLSKDGKTSRTILSKDNGIVYPRAISIDKTSSTLLVTNSFDGDAFVFKI
ncbi:Hypothetical predicted protein [Mytilus galloprovincialis]|uniref:B box-type domain-containing protein n=1 Tax=Mytilus galloprovincialis TaxID=29158 RepID=A0A8B6G614_MYTGA|nr:Hypothetical predicted protein [Mytilus galloprovincialis]